MSYDPLKLKVYFLSKLKEKKLFSLVFYIFLNVDFKT